MLKIILANIFFFLLPDNAFAWGPMTHAYFAGEILKCGSMLPPDIWLVIGNFRQDFLYGNLMADMIIGKKYLPKDMQFHNWDFALRLMNQANTHSEKSFIYGFLCHLAADTVAHRILTKQREDIKHAWIEFMADTLIDGSCRLSSLSIKKTVQERNDQFLKKSMPNLVFSFKTHKRIFKSVVLLSAIARKNFDSLDRDYLEGLHNKSMTRMLDVLINGSKSPILKISPSP